MPDCAWEEARDVCSRYALKSIGTFDALQYLRLEASREVPMPYELENCLVIGVASSAVFDLLASHFELFMVFCIASTKCFRLCRNVPEICESVTGKKRLDFQSIASCRPGDAPSATKVWGRYPRQHRISLDSFQTRSFTSSRLSRRPARQRS